MINKLSNRYDRLFQEITAIEATLYVDYCERLGEHEKLDNYLLLTWKVKVKNLLVSSCGKDSQHYEEFLKAEKISPFGSAALAFKRMKSVFFAAMDDYKGGYLISVKKLIQCEVFESELEQAQELLDSGYKLAAAVVAGVVLETTLRDLCTQENIAVGKLDKMNAELSKKRIYSTLQQKKITALADIRNKAAHGKQEEFSDTDVTAMIRDIEQFLITHLN